MMLHFVVVFIDLIKTFNQISCTAVVAVVAVIIPQNQQHTPRFHTFLKQYQSNNNDKSKIDLIIPKFIQYH